MVSAVLPYSVSLSPNLALRILYSRALRAGFASSILIALLAACSGGSATPTPTAVAMSAPTPTPAPTLTTAATPATPQTTGLLVRETESFEGYTLYIRGLVYLIDHLGRPVHKWDTYPNPNLAKLLDNGNLLANRNREIDPSGNVVWEYPHVQHHDILRLPNGNVLTLSRDSISREEAVDLGANPDNLACPFLWATRVLEVRPTGPVDGEVVWQWSALDHLIQDFDPEKPNYGAVADHPELIDANFNLAPARCKPGGQSDWIHANALDYNAELDQIMITARHFSEIWIIDHSTSAQEAAGHSGGNAGKGGDLVYRYGNPRAHRRGTAADQRLFWPHNAHWIPDGLPGAGNVLVFNNGAEYPGFERGYSSVDEFALPADGHDYRLDEDLAYGPNEAVWRYAADPPDSFYSYKRSSAQRLPNGATLIANDQESRIFEVTREGKTVWEFIVADAGPLFLSYRYAPDHPGIRALWAPYQEAYRAAEAGELVVRSVFDVYAADGELTYIKEQCEPEDAAGRFFLHVIPEQADDLPPDRRGSGFDNLDFDFLLRGAAFDGKCAARVALSNYAIANIRTGQFGPQGELWSADFAVGGEETSP